MLARDRRADRRRSTSACSSAASPTATRRWWPSSRRRSTSSPRGRAVLGIGAAWFEEEHMAYGFDYPSLKERFERLEEALQIFRLMFKEDVATFEGKHFRVDERVQQPEADPRRHPDPDRRLRRAQDAALRRQVRRRLQPVRRRRARQAPARRARGPLRGRRPRLLARSPRRAWRRSYIAPNGDDADGEVRAGDEQGRRPGPRPRVGLRRRPGHRGRPGPGVPRRRPRRHHDHDARLLRRRDGHARGRDARARWWALAPRNSRGGAADRRRSAAPSCATSRSPTPTRCWRREMDTPEANWCTFATWASRQAGRTIRGEDAIGFIQEWLGRERSLLHPLRVASGAGCCGAGCSTRPRSSAA